jgi:hypothetical protein
LQTKTTRLKLTIFEFFSRVSSFGYVAWPGRPKGLALAADVALPTATTIFVFA